MATTDKLYALAYISALANTQKDGCGYFLGGPPFVFYDKNY